MSLPTQLLFSKIGVSAGLDFGGFGAKVGMLSYENFEIFSGIGYNTLALGFMHGLLVKSCLIVLFYLISRQVVAIL